MISTLSKLALSFLKRRREKTDTHWWLSPPPLILVLPPIPLLPHHLSREKYCRKRLKSAGLGYNILINVIKALS